MKSTRSRVADGRGTDAGVDRSRGTPVGERSGSGCCLAAPDGAIGAGAADELGGDLELLANPVRLRLLSVLARNGEPVCVCDLEALVPVKQPTVSHHLKLLRAAGLIESERKGLWTYYSVRPRALRGLKDRIFDGLSGLDPVVQRAP